jgi:hypothetical protein
MSIAALFAVMNARVPDIGPAATVVLFRLADYAAPNGTGARPSVDTIVACTNLSRRTVQMSLAWLADANIIKCYKQAVGRGTVNVWALNMPLLERYAVKVKAKDQEDPPEFESETGPDDLVHAQEGRKICALSGDKRAQNLHERVQNLHERAQNMRPILLDPVLTLDAREKNSATGAASVQPEGRTPRNQDDTDFRKVQPLIDELAHNLRGLSFPVWANLVAAIVRRREVDAARSWLSRAAGCEVDGVGKILIAKNSFAKERILQTFGGLLSEMGWQVVIKGSG